MSKLSGIQMTCCAAALVFTGAASSWSQDVPFAQAGSGVASLSELMLTVLQRHSLLWSAGTSKNWPFATYEVGQMRTRFFEAASVYRNIPVEVVAAMARALDDVQGAIDKKDGTAFATAFDSATSACNACHAAADISFIHVRRPNAQTSTNLLFSPQTVGPRSSR